MEKNKTLTAPCGLDCFNCELHENNLTEKLLNRIHTKLNISIQDIPCKGCRQQDGVHFHLPPEGCATLDCVKEKKVGFCCECEDFPCAYLAPTAEGAKNYPHNIKIYNLCRIKHVGIDQWIKESGKIRERYFKGKFIVGQGQAIE